MRKDLNDEQLDQMMRTLMSDVTADDDVLKHIAQSPATWWAVRRSIDSQKDAAKTPWPPANVVRRWLLIGVPSAVAAALIISFFLFRSGPTGDQAVAPTTAPTTT